MDKRTDTDFCTFITHEVVTVSPGDSVCQIARLMAERNIGAVVVTENEKVAGIISERDLARKVIAEGRDPDGTRAADIMTGDVRCVQYRESLVNIIGIMRSAPFRHLPVLDGDKLIGIISNRDLLYFASQKG